MELTTLSGVVIERNLIDLSIILRCSPSLKEAKNKVNINLCYWLDTRQNCDGSLLPYKNKRVEVTNVKFVTTIVNAQYDDCVDFYTASASTTIIFHNHQGCPKEDLLENMIIVNDLLQLQALQANCNHSAEENFLAVIKKFHLSEENVEQYICLGSLLTDFKNSNVVQYYLFVILVKVNKMLIDTRNLEMLTVSSIISPSALDATIQKLNKDNLLPYFGNRPSKTHEFLIGVLTSCNGKLILQDFSNANDSIVIHMKSETNSEVLPFCNCLIVIFKYHHLSEIYPDGIVECLLVELRDVEIIISDLSIIINKKNSHLWHLKEPLICKTILDIPFKVEDSFQYYFEIDGISIANKVYGEDQLEVWLKVRNLRQTAGLMITAYESCYLVLGKEHLLTVSFLDLGRGYELYTQEQLVPCTYNKESNQYASKQKGLKLVTPRTCFIPTFNVNQVRTADVKPKECGECNIIATIDGHYINTDDKLEKPVQTSLQLGILAKEFQHRVNLRFADDTTVSLYLKNFSVKLTPEGLHPNVKILLTSVYYAGKYLSTNYFTNIRLLEVKEILNQYVTANLNTGTDKSITYESLHTFESLNLNYYFYLRTRVFVDKCEGELNVFKRSLSLIFFVKDQKGSYKFSCTEMNLLLKLLGNFSQAQKLFFESNGSKEVIDLTSSTQIKSLQKNQPGFSKFLKRIRIMLIKGIVKMDVLVKKMSDGTFRIVDIYKIN